MERLKAIFTFDLWLEAGIFLRRFIVKRKNRARQAQPVLDIALFNALPFELKEHICQYLTPIAPRELVFLGVPESGAVEMTTLSRPYKSLSFFPESTETWEKQRQRWSRSQPCHLLGASKDLDIVHLGPNFKMQHLQDFVQEIGTSKAKEIRILVLESQVEKIWNENVRSNRFNLAMPRFFEICGLAPQLGLLIFVNSRGDNRGSDSLDAPFTFGIGNNRKVDPRDNCTFEEFLEANYRMAINMQLHEGRRKKYGIITRPCVRILDAVPLRPPFTRAISLSHARAESSASTLQQQPYTYITQNITTTTRCYNLAASPFLPAMTVAVSRAPTHLPPRSKTVPTANTSSPSKQTSRAETPIPSRQNSRPSSVDPLSEKSTIFLIRRTLCSNLGDKGRSTPAPIDVLLPPLTSSNEVDLQLYAFIAIIIREFVQTWYSKITPDQVFVEEVIKIIAHCTRALEQRLRKVDLESLIFDELPELLNVHVETYRAAYYPLHPKPVQTSPHQIYHSLWPIPALSPVPDRKDEYSVEEQGKNEAAYRQLLVQGVLAVLLPTEDLENGCLTSLVGQVFSEMVIGGGIGGKASEPWLLWEGITKISEVIQSHLPKSKVQVRVDGSKSDALETQAKNITGANTRSWKIGVSIKKTFWLVLQYLFLAFTTVRFIIVTIATSSSLPSRIAPSTTGLIYTNDHEVAPGATNTSALFEGRSPPFKQPILKMRLWSCVANLLDLDARMPWIKATILMLQWGAISGPGKLGKTNGMIDKILSHAIQTKALDPALLPLFLRTARGALFPNNVPVSPRSVPSAAEQLLLRQRCAEAVLSLIPEKMQDVYFGPGRVGRVKDIEEILNIFHDKYCNKHLLYGVVELIVVRLIPELAEKGVEELLEERWK
ncbi:hypothetical protein B7494_g3924 [Chlorociboria aeruginascens]|nr:hypothetical protein B7494_g3924 [Chlorociboria aeruginascens]